MQPVPLAGRFFVALDDAGLRQSGVLVCVIRGTLDRACLERAWHVFQERFPVTRSLLERRTFLADGWRGYAWVEQEPGFAPVGWFELDPAPADFEGLRAVVRERTPEWASAPIDLRRQAPYQLRACCVPGVGSVVIWHGHHAVMDGISLAVTSQELVELYNELAAGARPDPSVPPVRLDGLGRLLTAPGLAGWVAALAAARKVRRWNRPRAHRSLPVRWSERSARIATASALLPPAALGRALAAARERGLTFNEAFLAGVARAACRFAQEKGAPLDKVTFDVPVNLRPVLRRHPRESVGNEAISVHLFVPAADVADDGRLIEAIRTQSRLLKETALPLLRLAQSSLLIGLPTGLLTRMVRRMLQSDRDLEAPSLIVSNTGRIWQRPDGTTTDRFGDAPIEGFHLVYQAAYPLPGTLALFTFRDQTYLQFSYAAGGLTVDESERFLELAQAELFAFLGVSTEAARGRPATPPSP